MKYGLNPRNTFFFQCCFFANVKFTTVSNSSPNLSNFGPWSESDIGLTTYTAAFLQARMVLPSPEELVFDKDVGTFNII